MFRRSLELKSELRGGNDATVADSLLWLAGLLNRTGRFAEAEPLDRQALAIYQKRFGREHATVGLASSCLGDVLGNLGRHAEAETMLREAVAINQKVMGPENGEIGNSMDRLGHVLAAQGKLAEAETYLRNGTKMLSNVLDKHPTNMGTRNQLAWGLNFLADALSGQGRWAEAEAVQREAVATVRTAWGEGHLEVTEQIVRLADILHAEGKISDLELLYPYLVDHGSALQLNDLAWRLATSSDPQLRDGSNAVRLAEKAVAATGRQNPKYLDTLAAAYAEAGHFGDAVNVQQEAIALMEDENWRKEFASRLKLYESSSAYTNPTPLADRVSALLAAGIFAEAEPLARECLALREKEIPDDWRTFNSRSMVGGALLGQKKYSEAEPLLLSGYEGLKQRESQIPAIGKPRLKEALQRLVQLYDATGRADKAAEWKQKLAEFEKAEADKQPAPPPR